MHVHRLQMLFERFVSCPHHHLPFLQPVEDANPVVLGRLVTDPSKPTVCFYGEPGHEASCSCGRKGVLVWHSAQPSRPLNCL